MVHQNHLKLSCYFKSLFKLLTYTTSKLRITDHLSREPPLTGGFLSQRASSDTALHIYIERTDRRPSHQRYFHRIRNSIKKLECSSLNMLYWSQRNFADVTTVILSCRLQILVVIRRVHFKAERGKSWSNFEFDRNIASGTGARSASDFHDGIEWTSMVKV